MLETVLATRYVTPLREGGSLPAIVEASNLGMYVLKFRGAGQGPLALVAEVVAGEIGRLLGLRIPELVLVDVDEAFGRNERDEEIRDLLRASVGINVGMDYLPGSVMFDPAAGDGAEAMEASKIVWFDAYVTNVDRTARNTNMLVWHKKLYLIDHGAAMYFHHNWASLETAIRSPFAPVREHVLLKQASMIREAGEELKGKLTADSLEEILNTLPDDWLGDDPDERRRGYLRYLTGRLEAASVFEEEAVSARAKLI